MLCVKDYELIRYKKLTLLCALLVIATAGLIIWFSAQDAATSSAQSAGVLRFILRSLADAFEFPASDAQLDEFISLNMGFFRKLAHFSIFCLFGVFMYSLLRLSGLIKNPVLVGLLCCAAFAATDELHQRFVSGRSGELRDVLIDMSGSLFGILAGIIAFAIVNLLRKKLFKRGIDNHGKAA